MARARAVRKGLKALQDLELLKLLKSEINFELSSNHFQVISISKSPSIHSHNSIIIFHLFTFSFPIFTDAESSNWFFR